MIELKNITKRYKTATATVEAIKDISLHIKEGELVVLKGRSGSGKSTILSLIAALAKPTSGEVVVDGEHISKLSDDFASAFRLQNIGFIFQRYNLFVQMSVFENIITPLIPLGLPKEEVEARVKKVSKEFSIEEKLEQKVRYLSGGEQQRVAISRALINHPKIILADEPTANLDAKLSMEFIEHLKMLKDKKRTIVVATHDPLFFDLDFVDRIIELNGGILCS
ncbi:ABC-type antimicrobial peptide transport system, ATPase component [hydrothermal vent metagenome]|uniref:ABC-type antimicrobial peptide transport system, ATPase component n=1 Tax=hydrothermal vent metagenome TaxID=652676 RepID=A0A1W1BUP9_9ZZZZ